MTRDAAALEVRRVTKRFGPLTALDGVDLCVAPGELVALLGVNGAGKTTLVRAICGRVATDAGSVRIAGADPARDPAARAPLGLVPQAMAVYPDLTVAENLEVLGRLAGVAAGDIAARVASALAWAGLADRRRSVAGTLSGGLKQRLNLAAGILHEPKFLLLDEPTANVDPVARESLHDLLRSLRERGVGLLLTTHDLEEAEVLADRVAILSRGRLRAVGTREELIRDRFGGARELTVLLSRAPDDAAAEPLRARGLEPREDGRRWIGAAERWTDLSELTAALEAAALPVAELRVREPSLRSVFLAYTEDNPAGVGAAVDAAAPPAAPSPPTAPSGTTS